MDNDCGIISAEVVVAEHVNVSMEDDIWANDGDFTPIHELPDEVLECIFAFLQVTERIKTESVCRRWRWLGKYRPWSWPKKLLLEYLPSPGSATDSITYLKDSTAKLALTLPNENFIDLHTCIGSVEPLNYDKLSLWLSRFGYAITQLEVGRWGSLDHRVSDTVLEIVAKSCPNLVAVKLVSIPLTGQNAEILSQHCVNLKIAEVMCNVEIEEKDLAKFFKACQALEYFEAYCWSLMTGECFDEINPNLQILRLKTCATLEPVALKRLMQKCDSLQEICFKGCCLMDQTTLSQAFNHYKDTLKVLNLDYYSGSADWYEGITVLHNLRELSVCGCKHVGDNLCFIVAKNCLKLKVLNVSDTRVTDIGLRYLSSALCLTELDVSETRLFGEGIKDLAMQGRLKKLNAAVCSYVSEPNTKFSFLAEWCPNLHFLDVSGLGGVSDWLVNSFRQAMCSGYLKGPLKLVVADTCVTSEVQICKGLEVVGNTYGYP